MNYRGLSSSTNFNKNTFKIYFTRHLLARKTAINSVQSVVAYRDIPLPMPAEAPVTRKIVFANFSIIWIDEKGVKIRNV